MPRTTSQYPHHVDWATVSRWIDAGKPDLNPDGTWGEPTEAPTHERNERS
ncbi:hypothetical protein [Microbacterium sp. CH12i]|nr:hypothetical protein [Microbacterium sp. CH12i]